jgi:NTE family protein
VAVDDASGRSADRAPRVGVVLGAGGYLGAAWLSGALLALSKETGFDPRQAHLVVGTSAGAIIAALAAAENPPAAIAAAMTTDTRGDADDGGWWRAERRTLPWPGSPTLAFEALRNPRDHTAVGLLAGWLPRGRYSTAPLKRVIARHAAGGWARRPGLWIVACDYRTGARVVFRSETAAERVDLPDAVAASCAVPGVYHPVRIGDREYVDGALHSSSNLDVVRDAKLDLVICLSPTSSYPADGERGGPGRLGRRVRRTANRRVAREAARVAEAGAEVVVIEPTARDTRAMGWNQLARSCGPAVARIAIETTREQLALAPIRDRLRPLTARGDVDTALAR